MYDESTAYFMIVPKLNDEKNVHLNLIRTLEEYKKYRNEVQPGVIFKSENQAIESGFIEIK
ncbi:hypothetical protein ACW95P_00890 [Candidatus Mycoplasma pogonae]